MRNAAPVLILLVLAGLAALALFGLPRENDFDRSPLGSRGLQVWLEAKGIPVIRSDPHFVRSRAEISMRMLSLPISENETAAPKGEEKTAEVSPEDWAYEAVNHELPTLIVMPKWRSSVLRDGIAGQSDLLALPAIQDKLNRVELSSKHLSRNAPGFEEAQIGLKQFQSMKIALYQAQTFDRESLSDDCQELVGMPSGALLVHCDDNPHVYLLSDPDLVTNHGLALADNASFAVALFEHLRGAGETRPVYIDMTGAPLDDTKPVDEGRSYERSSSDLKRFFAYPLSVIWGTLFVVVAICFWRGFWRFGPPLKDASGHIELSKSAAIEATARLLRLSGNDGRMVSQFVLHLLADKAQLLFGPGAGNEAGIDRLFKRMARHDHAAAQALHSSAQALIDRGHLMKRADLHRNLETFRKSLGSIDLGSK
ncbi:DUF4350 domain-containing protein [Rhizobium sp. CF142]|uniref:DUF4350 domain-containing protein n=1 Tax=Rhizobium sp. CF142 TaxID=1144314 RepID=UPI00026EF351|nr:hypothetical protein [Rhizobium sp. CF142]EJJ26590.1 hypothetical protein PMI11_05224 [Rhizobium sp. CF142]